MLILDSLSCAEYFKYNSFIAVCSSIPNRFESSLDVISLLIVFKLLYVFSNLIFAIVSSSNSLAYSLFKTSLNTKFVNSFILIFVSVFSHKT